MKTIPPTSWASKGTPVIITAADWPAGVEYIDNDAFNGCTTLRRLTLPAGIRGIGWHAFINCEALETVDFSNSFGTLTSIGTDTFNGCTNLESITFPTTNTTAEGYMEIGHNAFALCTKLQSLTLRGPLELFFEAFGGCSSLATVTVGDGINFFGYGIFARTGVHSIVLPENMGDVSSSAFAGNDGDFTVYVPRSVKGNYGLEEGIVECDSYTPRVFGLETVARWAEYGFTYQETTTSIVVQPGTTSMTSTTARSPPCRSRTPRKARKSALCQSRCTRASTTGCRGATTSTP